MRIRLFTLALVLLLGACVRPDPGESLDEHLQLFSKSVRWGHFDTAVAMTRTEDGPMPAAELEHYRRFRVTGYEEMQRRVSAEGDSAEVVVEISYTDADSGSVRRVMQRQKWLYQEEGGRWYLSNGMPDLK